MRDDYIIKRTDNIVTREIDDELVLVPISSDVADLQYIYTFNAVGAFIWNQIKEGMSCADILDGVIEAFAVTKLQATADVQDFLCELLGSRLIEVRS